MNLQHIYVAPYAGTFADFDIADHLRAPIDVTGCGNLGRDAAIGTNHDYGFFMLTQGFARASAPRYAGAT